MLNRKESIHFIGIGGAGMFPMAEVLHRNGYSVTGSDAIESLELNQLREWGIDVQVGHEPNLVKNADIVVHTAAVNFSNPEMAFAKEANLVVMKRAVMLGDLMRRSFSIGVAGTHGKTTTTSMIAAILQEAEKNPTVIVGGIFSGAKRVSGALVGDGKILVAEADEYDRSFLQMYPSVAVVTNIEEDHLDIYKDLEDIKECFCEFVHRVPFFGEVILCIDNEGAKSILPQIDKPVVTYGFDEAADFRVVNVKTELSKSSFEVIARGINLGRISLNFIGRHNLQNGMAAIAVAVDMGISFDIIARALANFAGVKRRMELIAKVKGVTLIDDYAHHPTEVKATLDAVKDAGYSRVTVIFQPHLYSRTAEFYAEFAESLSGGANRVFLAPIYKAREKTADFEGVTSKLITDKIKELGELSTLVTSYDDLICELCKKPIDGELIMMMGAGDIWEIGKKIIEGLK